MEYPKHILYDNFLYYKLQTDEIRKMISDQDRFINILNNLDINSEQTLYIYHRRDCLLFELHRRAFRNCIIQIYSVHKVKAWLTQLDPNMRCKCCKLEYYEFMAELNKIKAGLLPSSETIKSLVATNAFHGGRAINGFSDNFTPAISTIPTSNISINIPPIRFAFPKGNLENTEPNALVSRRDSYPSSDSSEEKLCLLENAKPDVVNFDSSERYSQEQLPMKIKSKLATAFGKQKKSYGTLDNEESPCCTYNKLKQEKQFSTNNRTSKEDTSAEIKTYPAWSFSCKLFK